MKYIPDLFLRNFPLYYEHKISIEELAKLSGLTFEETYLCIKKVGIIDRVEISKEEKDEFRNKLDNLENILLKPIKTKEDWELNCENAKYLNKLTDEFMRKTFKAHENVRSQLNLNEKFKDKGTVILDVEAELLIDRAIKIMDDRLKKMQGQI